MARHSSGKTLNSYWKLPSSVSSLQGKFRAVNFLFCSEIQLEYEQFMLENCIRDFFGMPKIIFEIYSRKCRMDSRFFFWRCSNTKNPIMFKINKDPTSFGRDWNMAHVQFFKYARRSDARFSFVVALRRVREELKRGFKNRGVDTKLIVPVSLSAFYRPHQKFWY